MERPGTIGEVMTVVAKPPEIILIFDNYRGKNQTQLANETMGVRAAVGALVYHSDIYKDSQKPIMCSFAGEHEPDSAPGAFQVADYLESLQVNRKHMEIRKNTITTTGDMMELHALVRAKNLETVAIVTTNDHARRAQNEVDNHFNHHGKKLNFYVLSPSSKIVEYLLEQNDPEDDLLKKDITDLVRVGQNRNFGSSSTEAIATIIATIPIRSIRLKIQKLAEDKTHPHTPIELSRIQRASLRFK